MPRNTILEAGQFGLDLIDSANPFQALTALTLACKCSEADQRTLETLPEKGRRFWNAHQPEAFLSNLPLLIEAIASSQLICPATPPYRALVETCAPALQHLPRGHRHLPASFLTQEILDGPSVWPTPAKRVKGRLSLNSDEHGVAQVLEEIEFRSRFGRRSIANYPSSQIQLLEVHLLQACRRYALPLVCRLLTALYAVRAPVSFTIELAINLLNQNQSPEGYIGYFDQEFADDSASESFDPTLIRLSMTLTCVKALLLWEPGTTLNRPTAFFSTT